MKLHEYQSKDIIQKENIDIPNGQIFNSINDFNNIDLFDSDAYVIKAQIHSGARGKAGLIQFANNKKNAIKVAKDLFGKKVKTIQSQGDLLEVNKIYIEEKLNIERQLYLAFILNHSKQSIEILYSSEGGVDIEENNQKIHSTLISQNKIFPFQTKKICNEFKIPK